MILRHDTAAMDAVIWGDSSNPDWQAMLYGASQPEPPEVARWLAGDDLDALTEDDADE
jgi:hypothetical protein